MKVKELNKRFRKSLSVWLDSPQGLHRHFAIFVQKVATMYTMYGYNIRRVQDEESDILHLLYKDSTVLCMYLHKFR